MVHRIDHDTPSIHPSAFIAHNAEVAGKVSLAEGSSVWFSATVRGDVGPIAIGKNTNVQDGAVLHCDPGVPTVLGEGVTVGHGAIVHSATVGDNTVIGMGAIILGGAEIGADSIVGAGALVTGGKTFLPRSLIYGNPAKRIRELTDGEIAANRENAAHYAQLAADAKESYQSGENS
jgi:carbonic anhydrase/acetyltransferase-like protein (isoleucine patch superfamily)